jgi:hypothetical protein
MKLELSEDIAKLAKAAGVAQTTNTDDDGPHWYRRCNLQLRRLDDEQLDNWKVFLDGLLGKNRPNNHEARELLKRLALYRTIRRQGSTGKIRSLEALPDQLVEFFTTDVIQGWIFAANGPPEAYVVTGAQYHPGDRETPATAALYFAQRDVEGPVTRSITIYHSDLFRKDDTADGLKMVARTCAELLEAKGYLHETPELIETYRKSYQTWLRYSVQFGKQFQITTKISHSLRDRRRWWDDSPHAEQDVDLMLLGSGKVINNHRAKENRAPSTSGRNRSGHRSIDEQSEFGMQLRLALKENNDNAFRDLPWLLDIKCFHLEAHVNLDLHVDYLTPYVWKGAIREKLVLPADLSELLDTLTEELDLAQEDIVAGKTGGNTILLAGAPGLGKTLTAEVYAEWRNAPLYKVHSGQLGTTAEEVGKALVEVLTRATEWGNVIVLLDEFDVFGRERGTDMEQNAIVAVFLRALEYQNNTLFLTTNRVDTMDDAILSRCAAILQYQHPSGAELAHLWHVMRDQFLPELADEELERCYHYAKEYLQPLSGRDIKSILKLASRYVRRSKQAPDRALVLKCAGFRGITLVRGEAIQTLGEMFGNF